MQENTMQQNPPLYSQELKTKGKMYFFDVKEAKNGAKYVRISENWMKNGQQFRGTVTVFKEQLEDFAKTFGEMAEKTMQL